MIKPVFDVYTANEFSGTYQSPGRADAALARLTDFKPNPHADFVVRRMPRSGSRPLRRARRLDLR